MNIPLFRLNRLISDLSDEFYVSNGGLVLALSQKRGWRTVTRQYDSRNKRSFYNFGNGTIIPERLLNNIISNIPEDQYETTYLLERIK